MQTVEIRGVDITDTNQSTGELLDALKKQGVLMNRSVLHRLRDGETSGNRIRYRINCEDLSTTNDASLKNIFYLEILSEALRLRDSREPDFRYDPAGFTENVTSDLSLGDSQQVRRALRAMRADLVYRELENPKALLNQTFKQAAGDFLNHYSKTPDGKPNKSLQLRTEWHPQIIPHFYELLYKIYDPITIGCWTPYEIDTLKLFYEDLIASGNHLTPFDHLALATIVDKDPQKSKTAHQSDKQIATQIRTATGIKVDLNVIYYHRSRLVRGRERVQYRVRESNP